MSVTGPRYNINAIQKLNEHELKNLTPKESSWHRRYRDSSYIFIGGLDTRLTEGDVVIVFSQWGDPVDVNIVRDKDSGKSKGFCFLAYEDQRSTDIAVDNANGMTLLGRLLRVDHVLDYKPPEQVSAKDSTTKREGVKKEGEGVKKEQGNEKTEKKDKEKKEEEEQEEEPEPYRATGPEGKGIGVYGSVGNGKVLKSVAAVYSSSGHYSEKRIKAEERQRGASSSWFNDSNSSKRRRHDDSIQESSRQPAKCPW